MTKRSHWRWRLAGAFAWTLMFSWLAGCQWATPSVDNAFSNLRVDVVKNDAPNYTVLVRNNSPDHLQVIVRSTASKSWNSQKTHEERFVLEPREQMSFPVPLNTKHVQVVNAYLVGR